MALRMAPWLRRLVTLGAVLVAAAGGGASSISLRGHVESTSSSSSILDRFLALPSNYSIAEQLLALTAQPHVAGTPGDWENAQFVAAKFREFGFDEVGIPSYNLFLSYPTEHRSLRGFLPDGSWSYEAALAEAAVEGDPYSQDPRATPTYNAYSPSGNVRGEVVYANYGREEDFAFLKAAGVDVNGSVVLVRYGKGYRGAKVRNAQAHGAAAVLIYSDPADYDPHGSKYPEGDGLPLGGVQRGSIVAGAGDPVTPGWPAARVDLGIAAETIDLADPRTGLPGIPTQPISALDALPLLERIQTQTQTRLPRDWVGALGDRAYGVGRGPVVALLDIQVDNRQADVWNVIGIMEGAVEPDRYVVLGNHRDAWVFGAVDPNSGTAGLLEIGRALGELRKSGWRPRRSIVLASWDAEEHCLGGSTEWGEEHELLLMQRGVAYLNVDSAVAGPGGFWASATPSLDRVVLEATKLVPDPDARFGRSLYDTWSKELGRLGDDGSDHGVFVQRLGVASTMLGFIPDQSQDYPTYHSVFDNYKWMAEQGDPGFHRHVAVAQVWGAIALTLAESKDLPFDYLHYSDVLGGYIRGIRTKLAQAGGLGKVDLAPMEDGLVRLKAAARGVERERRALLLGGDVDEEVDDEEEEDGSTTTTTTTTATSRRRRRSLSASSSPFHAFLALRELNDRLTLAERGFLDFDGMDGPGELPFRSWLRHQVYSPPQGNEYGVAFFPGVVDAIELMAGQDEEEEGWGNVQHQVWRAGRALDRVAKVLNGKLL